MIKAIKKALAVVTLTTVAFSFGSSASAQTDNLKTSPEISVKKNEVVLYARDPGGI